MNPLIATLIVIGASFVLAIILGHVIKAMNPTDEWR